MYKLIQRLPAKIGCIAGSLIVEAKTRWTQKGLYVSIQKLQPLMFSVQEKLPISKTNTHPWQRHRSCPDSFFSQPVIVNEK